MKKLIIFALTATMAIAMSAQSNQVSITVTTSWHNVYAWMWECPKQYNERFIPQTQVNDSTWTLILDMDETAYKKAGILFVSHPAFGVWRHVSKERVEASPNYRDGMFQNQVPTPQFTRDSASTRGTLWRFLTDKDTLRVPQQPINV